MALSLLCTFVAHITFLHVFFLPPLSFSLSLAFSFSLSLFLSLSLYLCPLFLSVVARHMSSDALYQIFSSWSILLFHTISFHSSYKILKLFTDYLLRLPSSELLEKHLFRSRANRRLVVCLPEGKSVSRLSSRPYPAKTEFLSTYRVLEVPTLATWNRHVNRDCRRRSTWNLKTSCGLYGDLYNLRSEALASMKCLLVKQKI